MGAASSKNVAENILTAKIEQSQTTKNNVKASCQGMNTLSTSLVAGAGSDQSTEFSNIDQRIRSDCNNTATLVATVSQKADQDLQQKLAQEAAAAVKGVNFGSSAEAENYSRSTLSSAVDLSSTVSQRCSIDLLDLNSIFASAVAGDDSRQHMKVTDANQDIDHSVHQECGMDSQNFQAASQKVTQITSQTASATTEGITGWVVVAMYAIYVAGGLGTTYIMTSNYSKTIKTIIMILFIIVSLIILKLWYDVTFSTPMVLSKGDSLWNLLLDAPYEQLTIDKKVSTEDSSIIYDPASPEAKKYKGLFTTQYSSVGYIDDIIPPDSDIAKQGLQNTELYGEDAAPSQEPANISTSYPTPHMAAEGMYDDDTIYAFEWIGYLIDRDGNIHPLESPVTIYYKELNEYFWNWDDIREKECLHEGKCTTCNPGDSDECDAALSDVCNKCYGRVIQQHDPGTGDFDEDGAWLHPEYGKFIKQNQTITFNNSDVPPKVENNININCGSDSTIQIGKLRGDDLYWESIPTDDIAYTPLNLTDCENARVDTGPHRPGEKTFINTDIDIRLTIFDDPNPTSDPTCTFTPIDYARDPAGGGSVTRGSPVHLSLDSSTNEWRDGDTPRCYNIGDKKCVTKPQCHVYTEAGKQCETGKMIDPMKEIEPEGGTCSAANAWAVKDSLSKGTPVNDRDWEACKQYCCAATPTPLEFCVTLDQDDCHQEGECQYNDSIIVRDRLLPDYPNTVGIKMFRDRSLMGTAHSYKEKIKIYAAASTVCLVIVLAICIPALISGGRQTHQKSTAKPQHSRGVQHELARRPTQPMTRPAPKDYTKYDRGAALAAVQPERPAPPAPWFDF